MKSKAQYYFLDTLLLTIISAFYAVFCWSVFPALPDGIHESYALIYNSQSC